MAIGLSLLYASAYFLPLLTKYSIYFIPSTLEYIFWPTFIAVVALTPIILLSGVLLKRGNQSYLKKTLILSAVTILTVISIKSSLEAAGYSWMNIVNYISSAGGDQGLGGTGHVPERLRWLKIIVIATAFLIVFAFTYLIRSRLSSWIGWLSTLGYAFVFLAIYRCTAYPTAATESSLNHRTTISKVDHAKSSPVNPEGKLIKVASRRVVWIIFDEMDYEISLGHNSVIKSQLPNFSTLVSKSVTAAQAYSPGKDTLYSIPALLLGSPLSGMRINGQSNLDLEFQSRPDLPFIQEKSIFAKIPAGPGSASILGFYHPYCQIFTSVGFCHSNYLGNAGRWFDGLTFFSEPIFSAARHINGFAKLVPEFLISNFDPMYRITQHIMSDLNNILTDSGQTLNFIHINLPHLPGVYAQKIHGISKANDDHHGYIQNLIFADKVLGQIIDTLEPMAKDQEILLIVSSDHWFRLESQAVKPIPFIAWKMGERQGNIISQPISTVHTAELALDFLRGKISSQIDISNWWKNKPVYPTWMLPDNYEF